MESDLRRTKPLAVATAYGDIGEWSPAYMEARRNGAHIYVGPVETSVRAMLVMDKNGNLSPIFRQWLTWDMVDGELVLSWITDEAIPLTSPPKFIKDGQSIDLMKEAESLPYEGSYAIRMYVPGIPGLGRMALRSMTVCHAWQKNGMFVNEPLLWVPANSEKEEISSEIAINLINYIASGIGPTKSPLFYQFRLLVEQHFQVSPWKMFDNAGRDASIVMADMGRIPQLFGKFFKLVKEFMSSPAEAVGIPPQLVEGYVPWFCRKWDSVEPDLAQCKLMARSHDTCMCHSGSWSAAQQLGIKRSTLKTIREEQERFVPPQLPPISFVEVKPPAAVQPATNDDNN